MLLQVTRNWEKVLLQRAWNPGKTELPSVEEKEIIFNRCIQFYIEWELFTLWCFYSNISHLQSTRSAVWSKVDLSAETRSKLDLSVCAPTPTRGAAPRAVPGACQDPDAELGKALAATSGCTARSKGSCANRSGIASGSGLARALLGHIFLLLTFVLSNVRGFHLLHTRVIWKGFLSDQQGSFLYCTFYSSTNPCPSNCSLYKFMPIDFCLLRFIVKLLVRSSCWLESCDVNLSSHF